jgi:hypothetical protein
MKTKQTSIYNFLAAILTLAFTTLSLTTCEQPADNNIIYIAVANSTANTTAINFTFSASVSGLTAGNITVTNGTGSVTKGLLSGSGTSWSLTVTVVTAGNVTVPIDKAGIESGNKTVAVSKLSESENITYTVAADSAAGTTAINFTFSASVSGLTAGDIKITNQSGSVTKGILSGSDTSWSLTVTVAATGWIVVSIDKAGIESGNKTVAVIVTVNGSANGRYSGTKWVLYEYALNGVNTIVFGNNTVTLTGSLFTGKSRTAWLRNDSRDVVGEHTSRIGDYDYTGSNPVYYDYNNGNGILLGRISGDELYVLVEDKGSAYSTRTFKKIASLSSDNGDDTVPVPSNFNGYIDSNDYVHMQWDAVSNASQYQICFIEGGAAYQFSSSGAPSGYVTTNSYTGPYPYLIANDPEIRTFVVRAIVNGKRGKFSSPAQFYPNIEIINYDEYPNYSFTSTVWSDSSGNGISFSEDTVTLTGSYWGTVGIEPGTYRSFILGTSGWLIQVITDEGNNTGFQIVGLVNNLDVVYGLQVQEKLPHIFSKTE